jgi:hypothetical protein
MVSHGADFLSELEKYGPWISVSLVFRRQAAAFGGLECNVKNIVAPWGRQSKTNSRDCVSN